MVGGKRTRTLKQLCYAQAGISTGQIDGLRFHTVPIGLVEKFIAQGMQIGWKLAAFKLGVGSGLIKWATWAAICVPAMVLVMWGVTSRR